MNVESIGTWAGLVWSALSEADVLGTKQLKKITKLKDKEVLQLSDGWLVKTKSHFSQTKPTRKKSSSHSCQNIDRAEREASFRSHLT